MDKLKFIERPEIYPTPLSQAKDFENLLNQCNLRQYTAESHWGFIILPKLIERPKRLEVDTGSHIESQRRILENLELPTPDT